MTQLRILLLDSGPSWRGGQNQVCILARELAGRGHSIHLAAPPGAPLPARAKQLGIGVHGLRSRNDLDLLAVIRLSRLIRELDPQIIHCNDSRSHAIAFATGKIFGSTSALVVSRRSLPVPHGGSKYRAVQRFAAVSKAASSSLQQAGVPKHKIDVVYSAVESPGSDERGEPESARFRTVTMAALEPEKGIDVLIKATSLLALRGLFVESIVLGEGTLRPKLEGLRRKLNAPVKFVGHVDHYGPVVRAADIMVHPARQEALGTAVLEGLIRGKPVVAADVGGIGEILNNTVGTLVPRDNPELLAVAMTEWCENQTARRMVETTGPAVAGTFSVDGMVEGTLGCYDRALTGKKTENESGK